MNVGGQPRKITFVMPNTHQAARILAGLENKPIYQIYDEAVRDRLKNELTKNKAKLEAYKNVEYKPFF